MASTTYTHLTHVQTLFETHQQYVHSHSVVVTEDGKKLDITYVPYAYDLIDAPLDFDEAAYKGMLATLDQRLLLVAKDLMFPRVTITRARMVYRHLHIIESQVTVEKPVALPHQTAW